VTETGTPTASVPDPTPETSQPRRDDEDPQLFAEGEGALAQQDETFGSGIEDAAEALGLDEES
jgi:hypothetical protein